MYTVFLAATYYASSNEIVTEARKDMWRVDAIGQGTFNHIVRDQLTARILSSLTKFF